MDPRLSGAAFRKQIALKFTARGVIIIDPESSYIDEQVGIGPGTVIEPGSRIVGGTVIGQNCHIRGPVYIDSCVIGDNCEIGPFSHLNRCRIGNNVKMRHFGYLGDAEVGDNSNIGAGVITSNYDGENKHKTKIGKGAFIGTGTNIVAPVTIGDEAGTAAGTVVTKDVPSGALAIRRPHKQTNKPSMVKKTTRGWRIGKRTKN